MALAKKRSALIKTSTTGSVLISGNVVNITGLNEFRKSDILSIKQIKYKAEVSQVILTAGGAYTPEADTKYTIQLLNPAFRRLGNEIANDKKYSYVTPGDLTTLGATAALQREAIHAALIIELNNDVRNFISAATATGGTGINITDDAGYFSGGVSGREGATIVRALTNNDGTGFVNSTATSTTTAAVYSFGVGTTMAANAPVYTNVLGGNLISGVIDAPVAADGTYAVAGQQYDAFAIQSLVKHDIPTISNQIQGYQIWEQYVFVDNGLGTTTTNRAPFLVTEKDRKSVV